MEYQREIAIDLGWCSEARPTFLAALDPTAELTGRESRGAPCAHSGHSAEIEWVLLQEGFETSGAGQESLCFSRAVTGAENQREQFCIGQSWQTKATDSIILSDHPKPAIEDPLKTDWMK
jgi:hypothetical protein